MDQPYRTGHGMVMKAWDQLAQTVRKIERFRPKHADRKALQARFNKLLHSHEAFNRESENKSGSIEENTEIIQLLDDVLSDVNDFKNAKEKKQAEKQNVEEGKLQSIQICRDQAVSRLIQNKRENESEGEETITSAKKLKTPRQGLTPTREIFSKISENGSKLDQFVQNSSHRYYERVRISKKKTV